MKLIKTIYAAIENPVVPIESNPTSYVNNVIQAITTIFIIVGVIYFIWHFVMSAYHMISSQGDPEKFKLAQKAILHDFIGIILIFSLFAIIKFVGTVVGIEGLKNLQILWPSL